ncbi:MAG: aminotransferase class V-fold PLP-dependent enzyme [Candidatus Latescibacterota bacterium]|jgi:glutamate/tyrosine decarboxylase-like PLP-dependent enzyme
MLSLTPSERQGLWREMTEAIEEYISSVKSHRVAPRVDVGALRQKIAEIDFGRPMAPRAALRWVTGLLWNNQVHTPHPRYYGLFNPNPTTMGIAADALVAAFNPQMAAWGHNPAACEIERFLIETFGEKFGYRRDSVAGSFTTAGAEANHTAVLCALTGAFPEYASGGARALVGQPVLYASRESHHSIVKAARLCGIGSAAVVPVPVDGGYTMDCSALASLVERDRSEGRLPFMVVATLGSTNAGVIDPVAQIADVARREGLWLHADAAWGGAAALVPELRGCVAGIDRADSITFDAHKFLSVPMGAGMFFTRHRELPEKVFAVSTEYMPLTHDEPVDEPHRTTMQWSRRFAGLKLFMSLAVAGWKGYENAIRHQTEMGDLLRERLAAREWRVVNRTPLPTVCFVDAKTPENNDMDRLSALSDVVVNSGRAWISTTRIGGDVPVIRACVTNYATSADDVEALMSDLDAARSEVGA